MLRKKKGREREGMCHKEGIWREIMEKHLKPRPILKCKYLGAFGWKVAGLLYRTRIDQ